MSYEEKWAKFGIPRTASDPARLRLAGAGGEGGNGGADAAAGKLKVTSSVLKDRAGKAEEVRGQFLKADDDVMRETGEVPGTLKGFTADEALKTFQQRWLDQMAYVKGEFTETAEALSAAAEDFRAEDRKHARSLHGVGGSAGKSTGKTDDANAGTGTNAGTGKNDEDTGTGKNDEGTGTGNNGDGTGAGKNGDGTGSSKTTDGTGNSENGGNH